MSVTAIIPVRSLTDGKTRLAPVLETIERYTLNARFLSHILGVTSALSIRTMVVSRCEEARKIGLDMVVIRSASLAFDVDSPSDFCQLQSIERDSPGRKLTKGLGRK